MRCRPLLCLLLLGLVIGLSEASLFGRMKGRADDVADDLSDGASRLKRKGEALADDAGETVSKLTRKGKAMAKQQKRELYDEDESAARGWRVPIFSGVADKFRSSGKKGPRQMADDYVEGAKQKGRRVVDEVQRKKRELLDEDSDESDIEERGFFGGVADRLRGRRQPATSEDDGADGPIQQAKKSTKRFGGDVADKLREKKREWSGGDDEDHESDEHDGNEEGEGFLQGLRSKFQRAKDDAAEGIEEATLGDKKGDKKGSWFSGKATKRADAYSEDDEQEAATDDDVEDDEAQRGFFGRMMTKKAAAPKRAVAEEADAAADSLKRKGWWLWKRAGDQAKKQKRNLQNNIPAPTKQGFFGRLSNRFSTPRKVADDIEDGADKLTKKGKKALGKATNAMKRKQAEWTEDSDLE